MFFLICYHCKLLGGPVLTAVSVASINSYCQRKYYCASIISVSPSDDDMAFDAGQIAVYIYIDRRTVKGVKWRTAFGVFCVDPSKHSMQTLE